MRSRRRRIEDADRPRTDVPGQLAGAGDFRVIGLIDESTARVGDALRCAADPSRIEKLARGVEVEDVAALDEERPSLGKKLFEGGQVDERRVGIDLAEVRIDRRIER